jgi:Mn2+/Fe2+ NRAMP family transporter
MRSSWDKTQGHRPAMAKPFYSTIPTYILVGAVVGPLLIDPIKALYLSAVINGLISMTMMAVIMLMPTPTHVMGRFGVTRRLKWLGWLATLAMAVAAAAMFMTLS